MLEGTGIFGTSIWALARLVASSAAFRTIVSAATEDEAMDSIYSLTASDRDANGALTHPRPRAIIGHAGFNLRIKGCATIEADGMLELAFELDPPAEYIDDENASHEWFCNTIGPVISEMAHNCAKALESGSGTYLNLRTLSLVEGPGPSNPDEENGDKFFGVAFHVGWE